MDAPRCTHIIRTTTTESTASAAAAIAEGVAECIERTPIYWRTRLDMAANSAFYMLAMVEGDLDEIQGVAVTADQAGESGSAEWGEVGAKAAEMATVLMQAREEIGKLLNGEGDE